MIIVGIILLSLIIALYWLFTIDLTLSKRQKLILVLLLAGGLLSLLLFFSPRVTIGIMVGSRNIWTGICVMGYTAYVISIPFSLLFSHYRQHIVFVTMAIILLAVFYSIFNGLAVPRVKEMRIPMSKLPSGLEGFTIVQLSDLHLGGTTRSNWWKQLVKKVNDLEPDLVVITGDLLKGFDMAEEWPIYARMLKQIKSGNGMMAVVGNHDVYGSFDRITGAVGIIVLNNRMIKIAGGIQVAGITDPEAVKFGGEWPDPSKALKSADPSLPLILLSHRPDFFQAAREYGIDLQLSGHTHAGQIPPIDLMVHFIYDYPYGLYKEGDSYIYTSCGIGVFAVPMRLFSRNEIVKIVLTKTIY